MADNLKVFGHDFTGVEGFIATDANGNQHKFKKDLEEADLKDVVFIDYDGSVLYSYTKAEFASLTEMPPNPKHTDIGLTAQGWNWSLTDAKNYVAKYTILVIGQTYITTSGNTEVDIELIDGRTSIRVGLGVNGSVVIDWGDGSANTTLTGTNQNTVAYTEPHNYASAGKYTISLIQQGTTTYTILADNNNGTWLVNRPSSSGPTLVYTKAIKAVRIGSGVRFYNNYYFKNTGISYVTIPLSDTAQTGYTSQFVTNAPCKAFIIPSGWADGVGAVSDHTYVNFISWPKSIETTAIGYCFRSTSSLRMVSIPENVTNIGAYTFGGSITRLWIPENVTTIGNGVAPTGLIELHCTPTSPPSLTAAISLSADCVIYVPKSTNQTVLNAYKTATNWSTVASQMVEEP